MLKNEIEKKKVNYKKKKKTKSIKLTCKPRSTGHETMMISLKVN
jgi:hypothetical protein